MDKRTWSRWQSFLLISELSQMLYIVLHWDQLFLIVLTISLSWLLSHYHSSHSHWIASINALSVKPCFISISLLTRFISFPSFAKGLQKTTPSTHAYFGRKKLVNQSVYLLALIIIFALKITISMKFAKRVTLSSRFDCSLVSTIDLTSLSNFTSFSSKTNCASFTHFWTVLSIFRCWHFIFLMPYITIFASQVQKKTINSNSDK